MDDLLLRRVNELKEIDERLERLQMKASPSHRQDYGDYVLSGFWTFKDGVHELRRDLANMILRAQEEYDAF